jgi:hypothetical protein
MTDSGQEGLREEEGDPSFLNEIPLFHRARIDVSEEQKGPDRKIL